VDVSQPLLEDIDVGLERSMVKNCGMRETCKAVSRFPPEKRQHGRFEQRVGEEVNRYRAELEREGQRRRRANARSASVRCPASSISTSGSRGP
jgi:hypothetical protein